MSDVVAFRITENLITATHGSKRAAVTLQETLEIRSHSPTGFNWGYHGSGPAQAALGCCMCLQKLRLLRSPLKSYQEFKARYIGKLTNADPTDEARHAEFKFPLHETLNVKEGGINE